mmetsp:Transcript_899/g.2087  ORF Transcript_899/g.2087 Transcript_899/m.2087 type:complete len:210 (+) Transcript_899:898-1527(+)
MALEGLSLSLATPHTQDEGNLDLRQFHEVLCYVHGELIEERLGNVEALCCDVVVGLAPLTNVVRGILDLVVSSTDTRRSLEDSTDHTASALDVQLVISRATVIGKASPPVLFLFGSACDPPGANALHPPGFGCDRTPGGVHFALHRVHHLRPGKIEMASSWSSSVCLRATCVACLAVAARVSTPPSVRRPRRRRSRPSPVTFYPEGRIR